MALPPAAEPLTLVADSGGVSDLPHGIPGVPGPPDLPSPAAGGLTAGGAFVHSRHD